MKVLIVSGTGWIGQQVARLFTEAGHEVAVTSRGGAGRFALPETTRRFKTERGDFDALDGIMKEWGPRVVMDMIPQRGDIQGILGVCRKHGIAHYLHCSSTAVYAPLEYHPADEAHPWDRETEIDTGPKITVDRTVLDAFAADGFPGTVIRPSYIQGEGNLPLDGLGGRYPEYWQRVLDGKPVSVPGSGAMLLQPVYYEDVASSFLRAVEHPDNSIGQSYIITGDKAVTLHRYITETIAAAGTSATIECLPLETYSCDYVANFDRKSPGVRFLIEHMCFRNDKAKRELEWRPSIDLKEGVRRTIAWSKEKLAGTRA
jgi:nucleoside-diphosphate-sugar epimerase